MGSIIKNVGFVHVILFLTITGMRVLGLAWDRVGVRQVAPLLIMK